MRSFTPPPTFSACKEVTLGDAPRGTLSDPKGIIMKLHVNWGRASGQQTKRVAVGPEGDNLHLHRHVDDVLGHCDVCSAFDHAPHVPFTGTPTVTMSIEEIPS